MRILNDARRPAMPILIADDDQLNVKLTTFLLEQYGYRVVSVGNGEEAIDAAERQDFDLVLLDVNLPHLDGFEVCRAIRRTSSVPIIFLSGCTTLHDRVTGLQLGGDDYITKPFEPLELLARIEAVLRRRDDDVFAPLARLTQGDLTLDPIEHRARFADGRTILLTPIEVRLLYFMMKHAGRALEPQQILDKVWGYDEGSSSNLVSVYVRRLRCKIERDATRPCYLVTVPNVGYKFEAHPAQLELVA
jgi:DNA-binding response OmpR family regulator